RPDRTGAQKTEDGVVHHQVVSILTRPDRTGARPAARVVLPRPGVSILTRPDRTGARVKTDNQPTTSRFQSSPAQIGRVLGVASRHHHTFNGFNPHPPR